MNTTIINNGLPKFTQATGGSGNASSAAATPSTTGSAGDASKADDQVKLTDSARAMQKAARQDSAAAIDSQRVDQVRQALASGNYQINPGKIANRMLALEQQMGGAGKA
ncbi:MAG: flagellar biosynthesis anti-sigma factor FlgM [Rhodanobacter sp.]|nr:MAG: flagellar biosynthesis anti-sigma factor FlgM [Rhodanobacter sp.]